MRLIDEAAAMASEGHATIGFSFRRSSSLRSIFPLSTTSFSLSLLHMLSSRLFALLSALSQALVPSFGSLSVEESPAAPPATESNSPGLSLEIVANPSGVNKLLLHGLPILDGLYAPHPLIRNRHVETIFATLFRYRPKVTFRRQCLRMPDDGTVTLDWPVGGADCTVGPDQATQDGIPLLILLAGLSGGSGDTYVRHLLVRARKHGWNVVVFNSRGCANSPVTSAKFYSGGCTDDVREVVKYLKGCFPASHLYAVGWSIGANILVRYVGEEGTNCLLTGAISLCNPFDLFLSGQDLNKGFNNVYDKALARSLRNLIKSHVSLFEGIGGNYNLQKATTARTMREFHDGLTIASFGYKSVDDYYKDESSSLSIKDVKIPLLCIQAADDPIAPLYTTPRAEILANSNCFLVITPRGGHLGWVAGDEGPFGAPWTDTLVMAYLELLETLHQPALSTELGKDQTISFCSAI